MSWSSLGVDCGLIAEVVVSQISATCTVRGRFSLSRVGKT